MILLAALAMGCAPKAGGDSAPPASTVTIDPAFDAPDDAVEGALGSRTGVANLVAGLAFDGPDALMIWLTSWLDPACPSGPWLPEGDVERRFLELPVSEAEPFGARVVDAGATGWVLVEASSFALTVASDAAGEGALVEGEVTLLVSDQGEADLGEAVFSVRHCGPADGLGP